MQDQVRDRRALQSVATQFFVNGAVFASFVPRLPEIRDQVGIRVGTLGLIMTLAGALGMVGSLVVGPLLARHGTRRLIIGGAIGLVGCLPIVGFATDPLILLIGLSALSALDVLVDISMNMQGSWLSARRHRPVMSRLHGLWSLGTLAGGLAAAQLAAAGISLRVHLVGASAVLLIAVVFVGRGLLVADEPSIEPEPSNDPRLDAARRRTARTGLLAFALAGATGVAMEMTSSDWAAFRLTDDFAAGAGLAGLAYVCNVTGMTFSRLVGDSLQSRLGRDRHLSLALATTAIGLAMASLSPHEVPTFAGYLLAGLGIAPFMPRLYDDAVRFPGRAGRGLAALTAGIRVAALGTPVIVGSLAATSLGVGQATAIVTLPSIAAFGALSLHRMRSARIAGATSS